MIPKDITWVGGSHDFALPLPLIDALQERCGGDGIGLIYRRLETGQFKYQDVIFSIAFGLHGGGMDRQDAIKKVQGLYEDHGLNKLVVVSMTVIAAALNGWPDVEVEDSQGEGVSEDKKSS